MKVVLEVNGKRYERDVSGLERLLDVLRGSLGLTGTKDGCGDGECGSCTVLLNGQAVNSCLVPVSQADGAAIITVEGVGIDFEGDHPLQQALYEAGPQCGFCVPGIIMSGFAFLERQLKSGEPVNEEDIRRALTGNLCRCSGYSSIVDAIASTYVRLLDERRPRRAGA